MFQEVKKQTQKKFDEISKDGNLFYVNVDRDKIWEIYLNAFDEELRQGNNCNCCKSFLRQYGGVVGVKDNKIVTLWDFEIEGEYAKSIKALRDYVVSLPIAGIFLNPFAKCGTDKNPDPKNKVIWNHFYFQLPAAFVKKEFGPVQANALDNKNVLQRSLNEITDDAVSTTLELINQGSIYRGNEFKGMLTEFSKIRAQYKKVKGQVPRDNFCWLASKTASPSVTRIRNSSIGTLLNDLSGGRDLDGAVAAFEKVVAPANYKRPTALITPRMIEQAQKRLEELGLTNCLYRRQLSNKDLTVNNALFVYRPTQGEGDIFAQLKQEVSVNPKTLSKVDEVSIQDFIEKVLPTAKSIKLLVENRHLGNFVSLVGPKDDSENTLFKYGNNYSWSYAGEVADSIKSKVKAAGGKVDGILRVSLAWNNRDDLDLHLIDPSGHRIYYGNKRTLSSCGATLDIDANGGDGIVPDPVENIYWTNLPKIEGKYQIIVNNYNKRDSDAQGYEVEVEYKTEVYNFSGERNGTTSQDLKKIDFSYTKKDGVVFAGKTGEMGKYPSKESWGIKTGQFHKVNAITFSPNFWNVESGNKHYFFFLEGCKTEGKIRPFFNEFLKEELLTDRKVFEVLGSKVEVEKVENELSGLGFSDTIKDEIFVEVEGSFKRTLKIKF